jgi:hypothetical protein
VVVEPVMKIKVCKDPVTRMIFGKFRYKVVYFWFIIHILLVLFSVYHRTLTSITLPFESSVENFYVFLILGTLGIILVIYFLESIPKTFVELWENRVIQSKTNLENSVEIYNKRLMRLERTINSKKSYIIAVIYPLVSNVIVLYSSFMTPVAESPVIMYCDIRVFPLSGIMVTVMYIILYFLLTVIAYKAYFSILFLRRLRNDFRIIVRPLHPDRCGGLKPVGNFCIKIDYILLVVGLAIAAFSIFPHAKEMNTLICFALFLYVFFATFFFFYPLWTVHDSMETQKRSLLNNLNEKLDSVYQETYEEIIARGIDVDERKLNKIEKMDMIYERANKMPVWPFDVGNLIRFLTTIFIPVMSIVVNAIARGG